MTLRRVIVSRMSGLRKRVETGALGPVCKLCSDKEGKPIQIPSMQLVESLPGDGKDYARVLMKCHGQEELVEFKMGSVEWDFEELRKLVNKQNWFDPAQLAGVTEER